MGDVERSVRDRSAEKDRCMRKLIVLAALLAVGASQSKAQGKITAVVNAASFQTGLPSGGGLATIFCSGLVPTSGMKAGTYIGQSFSPLPYDLGGLRVVVNGVPAPMLAVVLTASGEAQINIQVPLERNASLVAPYTGSLLVELEDNTSRPVGSVPISQFPGPSIWGGFFADANGYAVAQHASDYSSVTPQNPARAGEAIIVYADDFFRVWPPPPVGFPVPQQPLFSILPASSVLYYSGTFSAVSGYLYLQDYPQPTCIPPPAGACGQSFANTPALQVAFEGLAPGQIGVEQINFVVPANQAPGDWALFFNDGSCPDGIGPPDRCATSGGLSSPYVKLPVR